MNSTPSPLEAALEYARYGWFVLPLHTPIAVSEAHPSGCDCRKLCEDVGKHPRTRNGVKDASVDEAQIRRWWAMFPTANVGIDLARSRLLDVAPDSLEWSIEFSARGLPETMTVQSGGGPGHQHHLYRMPEGVPQTRVCRSGEYDILSAGYAILPPSLHRLGTRYEWVYDGVLADPPGWAREMLYDRPKASRANADTGPVVRDGMFNKVLESVDQRAWNGTLFENDRSKGLVAIAGELAQAGCNEATILHYLAERDVSLGWNKYADRTDRDVRYEEITLAALDRARDQPPRIRSVSSGAGPAPAAPRSTSPDPEDMGDAEPSELADVEYIENLLKPGRILLWAAVEGVGKSYTVDCEMGIRFAVAKGKLADTWQVLECGKVLLLSEMHRDDDIAYQQRVLESLGRSRRDLSGRYYRLSLASVADGQPLFGTEVAIAWLIGYVQRTDIKLLIVDTVGTAIDGEPWGKDLLNAFRMLWRIREECPALAVVLVAHMKKPMQGKSGGKDITDVMGQWTRYADVVILQEPEDAAEGTVKLSTRKRLRKQVQVVVTQRDGLLVEGRSARATPAPRVDYEEVLTVIAAHPDWSSTQLAEAFDVPKRTMQRYLTDLSRRGRMHRDRDGQLVVGND